jgi:hypothetical protein
MGKILKIDNFFKEKRKDKPYPPHQVGEMLEHQFYEYFIDNINNIDNFYTYIPVLWTNLYANFRGNKSMIHNRVKKDVIPLVNPNEKYFTIVQSAMGIEMDMPKNVVIFSQGGKGDIKLPLISSPVDFHIKNNKKDIFASFIGRNTHKCREILYNNFKDKDGYVIDIIGNSSTPINDNNQSHFKNIMSRSIFSISPRGFGPTSFRLYECMWYDSIPVYIYDNPWLPYDNEIDWGSFCVLVNMEDIDNLDEILHAVDVETKLNNLIKIRDEYFTFEGVISKIIKKIK